MGTPLEDWLGTERVLSPTLTGCGKPNRPGDLRNASRMLFFLAEDKRVDSTRVSPREKSNQSPARSLDTLLVGLGFAIALSVVATTIQIIKITYFPLPLFDAWDHWRLYLIFDKKYSNFLFFQHNEHRIAVARIFFWIDHFIFHGRSAFLIVCSFLIQAATWYLLWRLARRAQTFQRHSTVLLASFLAACLFSAQQFTNLTWGFQIQFVAVYCAAVGALFSLLRTADHRDRGASPIVWLIVTCVVAIISTYSMANGLLIWPVLLLLAIWLRLPRSCFIVLAIGTILLGTCYLWGYHRPSHHADPVESIKHVTQLVEYAGSYLGSPVDPLATPILQRAGLATDTLRILCSAAFGCFGGLLALALVWQVWRKRAQFRPAQAVLAHILIFIMAGAALVSMGRINLPMIESLTYRYHTPALIFWSSLIALGWSIFEPKMTAGTSSRSIVYVCVVLAMFFGLAIQRPSEVAHAREYADLIEESQAALVADVFDVVPWTRAYHTPPDMFGALDYLRTNRLSVFTEDWTRWSGTRLADHFIIDNSHDSCLGHFDDATPVMSAWKPGIRVAGWAWDRKANRSPETVVLADDNMQVVGVARSLFDREDVRRAVPSVASTRVGWRGYVAGIESRNVTAYLLERDQRSLCPLSALPVGNAIRELDVSQLDGTIAAPVQAEGAWTIDGYHPTAGHPGIAGPVYGSWSGADSNTGVLRIGSFQIANQAKIAIPLTTGPKTEGLLIKVENSTTGELIAALPRPPLLNHWWAWQVDLPVARLPLAINIVAEDVGKEWGQWLAVGMPHFVKGAALSDVANVNNQASEIAFDRLSSPMESTVSIQGGWTKDGCYPGITGPPLEGSVYCSWSGGDGNKGLIQLGPFHVRNSAAIAIPLITGPRNVAMEVKVLDVNSGELLGILSPAPLKTKWWAWSIRLPRPDSTIMITAEDNGSGWGQWQGIGVPHLIR